MPDKPLCLRTGRILSEHGLALKKQLGQNFMLDHTVLIRMAKAANLLPGEMVFEIGSGLGALTEVLATYATQVVALECDPVMAQLSKKLLTAQTNIKIVEGDILHTELAELFKQYFSAAKAVSIVANLPYYITSPIICKLLGSSLPIKKLVLMMQREVAERLLAKPGNKTYGYLTVRVQYYAEVKWLMKVPRQVFLPVPNVDSAVVVLTPHQKFKGIANEEKLWTLIQAAFANRRKKLFNSLLGNLGWCTKEQLKEALERAGINGNQRAEELAIEDFLILYQQLNKKHEN
ncbi:MAG: dimethyladenosine transferase [Bacillota bacterium]|jgi:16S rRNA (adenine1518-N6/adenine1519-N6)-dimethyltransferase